MAIGDDFSVAANGDIRYTGTTANYTVLQLHRWLQDLADDPAYTGDDALDITGFDPSRRDVDSIIRLNDYSQQGGPTFNIDDATSRHLYNGSISQRNGADLYSGIWMLGITTPETTIPIILQDDQILDKFWGTSINQPPGGVIRWNFMLKSRANGAILDNGVLVILLREYGQVYTQQLALLSEGITTIYIEGSPDRNNETPEATVATWSDITNTEGYQLIDVEGTGTLRPFLSRWEASGRSKNDLYERTKWLQRRGSSETLYALPAEFLTGLNQEITYDNKTVSNFMEKEIVVWGTRFNYDNESGTSGWTVGEYLRIGSWPAKLLYVEDNGTTGTMIVYVQFSLPISDDDNISQLDGGDMTAQVNGTIESNASPGGRGMVLGHEDSGTTGRLFVEMLSGVTARDDTPLKGLTTGAEAFANGPFSQKQTTGEFLGFSTGKNIYGSLGIGIEPQDLDSRDALTDLNDEIVYPRDLTNFAVTGLEAGEDYVLVGPDDGGGGLDLDQLELTTTLSSAAEATLDVTSSIPLDTPPSGTIRVQTDAGLYKRVEYTSYLNSTFTLVPTDFSTETSTSGNNVFISYIDTLAGSDTEDFATTHIFDRSLVIVVRDGGVTPIEPIKDIAQLSEDSKIVHVIRKDDT